MSLDNLFGLDPNPNLDHQASTYQTTNFLACLAVLMTTQTVVEAGAYHGRTACAIAKALRAAGVADCHVWTAEPEHIPASVAQSTIDGNGLNDHITLYEGDYLDMLETIERPIDLAYIDGGVRGPMVTATLPLLSKEGLIVVDDMNHPWGDDAGFHETIERCALVLQGGRGLGIIGNV